jgi:hypothetical protein
MPPCQTSTFTPDGVNIINQPERITLEPIEIANVSAEIQEITNGLLQTAVSIPIDPSVCKERKAE